MMLSAAHDPAKACPDLIREPVPDLMRDEFRFADKIMRRFFARDRTQIRRPLCLVAPGPPISRQSPSGNRPLTLTPG